MSKPRYIQSGGYADVFLYEEVAYKIFHFPGCERKEFMMAELIKEKMQSKSINTSHLLTYLNIGYISKEKIFKMYENAENPPMENLESLRNSYALNGKIPCIQMKYIEGMDGITFHHTHGLLTESIALSLLIQLLEALQQLHLCGVLHCDIKPENFIIQKKEDGSYHLTLIDYGLSMEKPIDENGYLVSRGLCNIKYLWYMDICSFRKGRYYVSSELYSVGKTFLGLTGCKLRYKSKLMTFLRKITDNNPMNRGTVGEAIVELRSYQSARNILITSTAFEKRLSERSSSGCMEPILYDTDSTSTLTSISTSNTTDTGSTLDQVLIQQFKRTVQNFGLSWL